MKNKARVKQTLKKRLLDQCWKIHTYYLLFDFENHKVFHSKKEKMRRDQEWNDYIKTFNLTDDGKTRYHV